MIRSGCRSLTMVADRRRTCARSFRIRNRLMHNAGTCTRLILAVGLTFIVAGCQTWSDRRPAPEPKLEPEIAPGSVEPARDEPVSTEQGLSVVIDLLNRGRGKSALERLRVLEQHGSDSAMVSGLKRQIVESPEALLPGPYREITVAPGESLALIAGRELGDSLLFYALARLNGIRVPSRLAVGTRLRIPQARPTADGSAARDAAPESVVEPTADSASSDNIEMVARYLEASGQPEQARRMLIDALGDSGQSQTRLELLESMTERHAMSAAESGRRDAALVIIDQTLAAVPPSKRESFGALNGLRSRLEAEFLIERARAALAAEQSVEAVRLAARAQRLQPESESIAAAAARLREVFVEALHNRALTAWRDRNVDLAIRTWQILLGEVPDFEPAAVYLKRATKLRQRLDAPPD